MKSPITARHVALGIALLGSAITLSAPLEGARVAVDYRDLDMARPEAAQVLYRRLSVAARTVCREPGRRDLSAKRAFDHCYRTAVSNAVDEVNEQTLTALHRASIQRTTAG